MDKQDAEAQEPVAQFVEKLRDLRLRAGNPSMTQLTKLTKRQGPSRAIPRSTIQDKLSGATVPTLEHVLVLVGCLRAVRG